MRVLVVEDEPKIAADIAAVLRGSAIAVDVVDDGEDAWFNGDTEDNLIENGARFARATIRISSASRPEGAEIVVTDDGPGIPDPDRAAVLGRGRFGRRCDGATGGNGECRHRAPIRRGAHRFGAIPCIFLLNRGIRRGRSKAGSATVRWVVSQRGDRAARLVAVFLRR